MNSGGGTFQVHPIFEIVAVARGVGGKVGALLTNPSYRTPKRQNTGKRGPEAAHNVQPKTNCIAAIFQNLFALERKTNLCCKIIYTFAA